MEAIRLCWVGPATAGRACEPIGQAEQALMERARESVEENFGMPTRIRPGPERPDDGWDPRRGQWSSARLLRTLLAMDRDPAEKVLGITDVDLFIPVLTFVFGEAQLGGAAALVSTARLAAPGPFGAVAPGPALVAARLAREAVHEVGHTFGLIHCDERRCAMARSVTVLDIDVKRASLCADCRIRFRERRPGGSP